MLKLSLINYLLIISIFGYSFIFKKILYKKKFNDFEISNLDFFYGIIFIYFISLLFHFIVPLSKMTPIVIIFGITSFLYCLINKQLKISLIKYFLTVLIFSIIAYYGRDNVDSPLYHLQVINWLTDHKLVFGIANLEYRYGINYPWYSILGLLNIEYLGFSNKYYYSLIIFSFIFYELLANKELNKSLIFLSFSLSYLFLFGLIHPFNYGVILNHIGNPEKDLFNMLLFLTLIYVFIKIYEYDNHKNKKNLISIYLIVLSLVIMQTPIYGLILLTFLFIFFKDFKIKDQIRLFSFLSIIFLLWSLKSVAINGCLVFPISITCLNTDWTIDISTLNYMVDEMKRWCRSLPGLEMLNDEYRTLKTFLWFKPWFLNYYLETAMHQINSVVIIFSLVISIYLIYKKIFLISYDEKILLIAVLLVNITCTILIPEIRYYWGPHISLSCLLLTLVVYLLDIKMFKNKNIYLIVPLISLILFTSFKVIPKIKISNLDELPKRVHDFSSIKKIGTYNNYDVFTNYGKCADFDEICVTLPKKKYEFINKYSYLIILR